MVILKSVSATMTDAVALDTAFDAAPDTARTVVAEELDAVVAALAFAQQPTDEMFLTFLRFQINAGNFGGNLSCRCDDDPRNGGQLVEN